MNDEYLTELLTYEEAAALLRISPNTLRSWVREGRIPAVHLGRTRGTTRIHRAALVAFAKDPQAHPAVAKKRGGRHD